MNEQVDVVIITALEKERNAVLRHVESSEEVKSKNRIYHKAKILHERKNTSYKIVVLSLFSMGNVEAAIATTQAIDVWNPSYIILTGIAGGIQEEHKRFLGDLVVGEQIVGYELGRITDSGIQPRHNVIRPASLLLDAAKNLEPEKWILGAKVERPDGSTGRIIPKVHFGVVASGEKVIASNDFTEELKKSWSKLIGIEMESYGTAMAAYKAETVPGMIMIKGVCDWSNSSKNDDWQEYAADIAATYVIALLKSAPFESKTKIQPVRINTVIHEFKYSGRVKLQLCRRLRGNWRDLADYFDIPLYERDRFNQGDEPRCIWEWLEIRHKIDGLKDALEYIDRSDLTDILDGND